MDINVYGFMFSQKELEENGPDSGVTFCEDCRQEHIIQYHQCDRNGPVLGFYKCGDDNIGHSLNKLRLF